MPEIVVSKTESKEDLRATQGGGGELWDVDKPESPDISEGKVKDAGAPESPVVGWEEGSGETTMKPGGEGGGKEDIATPDKLTSLPRSEVGTNLEESMSASMTLERRAESFVKDMGKKERLDSVADLTGTEEEKATEEEEEQPCLASMKAAEEERKEPTGAGEPSDTNEVVDDERTSNSPPETTTTYDAFDFVFEASRMLGELSMYPTRRTSLYHSG